MSRWAYPKMDNNGEFDEEQALFSSDLELERWPVVDIDTKKAKFPCCLVWTPLPVVSWLAPFLGHVGVGLEDGEVVDFSGSNLVNIDNFAFGGAARYLQLDRNQSCFPSNHAGHKCANGYMHSNFGTAISWDDGLRSCVRRYESKTYNLFTCNSHSFVSNFLNRVCFQGSLEWNMVTVAALILFKGKWINHMSIVRSFFPFAVVIISGVAIVGWPFLIGLLSFSLLLLGWFVVANYLLTQLLDS